MTRMMMRSKIKKMIPKTLKSSMMTTRKRLKMMLTSI